MEPHETKKLLQKKRNGHQIKESAHEWEKIFSSFRYGKRFITRIYREIKNVNSKKQ
jgi:hypothetical protein